MNSNRVTAVGLLQKYFVFNYWSPFAYNCKGCDLPDGSGTSSHIFRAETSLKKQKIEKTMHKKFPPVPVDGKGVICLCVSLSVFWKITNNF